MAWNKNKPSIKLLVAQRVFPQFNIEPVDFNGKVVGYRATFFGESLEDNGLTTLCVNIVQRLVNKIDRLLRDKNGVS